jgi:hypothetical protein
MVNNTERSREIDANEVRNQDSSDFKYEEYFNSYIEKSIT